MRYRKIAVDQVLRKISEGDGNTRLTRGEACALIAARVKKRTRLEEERTTRARIGAQLDSARASGRDVFNGGIEATPEGEFRVDAIRQWLEVNYGPSSPHNIDVSDLPAVRRTLRVDINENMHGSTSNDTLQLPSIEALHQFILNAWKAGRFKN